MKEDTHVFQGMKRDSHPIKQEGKFLWDAHNIRITNREDNTLLSITNEKGTSNELKTFQGSYVGHCVLGKYLIVFTANDDFSDNFIYRVEKTESGFKTIILFHKENAWDKGWSPNHPIETLGIYETELVQKVYWVDGINQPRMINIAKPELKCPSTIENSGGEQIPLLIDGLNLSGPRFHQIDQDVYSWFHDNYKDGFYNENSFDFVRTLSLTETVYISKIYGQGQFSPGTIQYAFSYYNKYEQESNIFYTSPLQYITYTDRGGNGEDKVANSFRILIDSPNKQFEYVRIYSIQRTSLDATPIVKVVEDISTTTDDTDIISYVDTGTTGYTIDPQQLLYIGGQQIVATCMAHKDGTLFMGNITQKESSLQKSVEDIILKQGDIEVVDIPLNPPFSTSLESVYYDYTLPLNQGYNARFKAFETYRCGVQVQYEDGRWSDPIFYADMELCDHYPWESQTALSSKAIKINNITGVNNLLKKLGVKKIRACVVFPQSYERDIICQGVLCPTVYSVNGRGNDQPYASSSWFFRPAVDINELKESDIIDGVTVPKGNSINLRQGSSIEFRHNYALLCGTNRGAEIQNMIPDKTIKTSSDITKDNLQKNSSYFFVDENIVTFHTPDVEFDTNFSNYIWDNTHLRIIGMAKLGAISGDIDITTSTPPISATSTGFIHTPMGYQTRSEYFINGGLVSGLFYRDSAVTKEYTEQPAYYWQTFPWHRSGSLNNDERRAEIEGKSSTRTAVLSTKVISNLKFFDINTTLGEQSPFNYKISTPQLFQSNEVTMLRLHPAYLKKDVPYFGNVDTLVTTTSEYPINACSEENGLIKPMTEFSTGEGGGFIQKTTDAVRMKYKSSPHLVFSLGDSKTEIPLLPRASSCGSTQNGEYIFPSWQTTGSLDGSNDDIREYQYIIDATSNDSYYFAAQIFPKGIPESKVGKAFISHGNGHECLNVIYKSNTGEIKYQQLSSGSSNIIVKITKGSTYILNEGAMFPNTNKEDYNYSYDIDNFRYQAEYIGPDRYYKVPITIDNYFFDFPEDLEEVTITTGSQTSEATTAETQTTEKFTLSQKVINQDQDERGVPYLLIGELVRDNIFNKFGGTSKYALTQNLWVPAGDPVIIPDNGDIVIPFEYGDTWYSRYDCLKTYPFTQEDENQIVEIGSFLCETRVNIDGRWDRNRGQLSNINMSPQNFNLMNDVYSQKDNFFNYRILEDDYYKQKQFNNQVTWSKEKTYGETIDTWANVTLASTMDMPGDKGKVTALDVWNDTLLCFQQKALSKILFNSRVEIPGTDGVPIEISNNYKVDGCSLISDVIGCNNKWSIINTSSAVYFIDSNTNSLYLYSDNKLTNLSETMGMSWWFRGNNSNNIWNPIPYNISQPNGIRSFYDSIYKDIYFTPGSVYGIDQPEALCFSEPIAAFTSFMSYGGTQAMFNYDNGFYSLRESDGNVKLYQNNVGKYNSFYGVNMPFSISFISNSDPLNTKIFDTVELRADSYYNNLLTSKVPFSSIKAENEYQKSNVCRFADNKGSVKKKFRVWRMNIPRSSKVASRTMDRSDIVRDTLCRARIRNPWTMITLTNDDRDNNKVVIHDLTVKYTI